MTTEAIQTLALNGNWLNGSGGAGCTGGDGMTMTTTSGTSISNCTGGYFYQTYPSWTYPVYVSSPARPIKLTLSEIERLRKAAKADKAIKAILAKFTDQIEIAVDFE